MHICGAIVIISQQLVNEVPSNRPDAPKSIEVWVRKAFSRNDNGLHKVLTREDFQ